MNRKKIEIIESTLGYEVFPNNSDVERFVWLIYVGACLLIGLMVFLMSKCALSSKKEFISTFMNNQKLENADISLRKLIDVLYDNDEFDIINYIRENEDVIKNFLFINHKTDNKNITVLIPPVSECASVYIRDFQKNTTIMYTEKEIIHIPSGTSTTHRLRSGGL